MKNKSILFSLLLSFFVVTSAFAQSSDTLATAIQPLTEGELFQGLSRTIPNGRVILPYGLEVTFDKTTHLIFPSAIRYVDLGSQNLIAGKAEDTENVLRIKAAIADFEAETNLSVICEDGSFYAFNVKYAKEPQKLNIEMKDFLSPMEGRLPSNRADIYFKELGNESPILVKLIMQTIYQNNKRSVKHIGAEQFGIRFLLRGIYAHNGLLYFLTKIENHTHMPYKVDFISFKVVDKKIAKRTAMQEEVLQPLRTCHEVKMVGAKTKERSVFALAQFSLSEDKQLEVTLYEQNSGRTLTFYLTAKDMLLTKDIHNLQLKW